MEQTNQRAPGGLVHGSPYLLLDLIAVLIFVAVGRDVHGHADDLRGLIKTSWPFAVGVVLGWLVTRQWRNPISWSAVIVWLVTVGIGMILRVVTDQGIAIPFIFVSLGFFALTQLGWRIVVGRWLRWHHRAAR
ncbi:DUF3054 domain-containing protein [Ferrimicrobium sp.]|uniref:DUF3054 domain-containing protein n=1 Tax=Ferrimicrobium sp. TaxID=2926050 RepID=UPI00260EEA23|nr:DUF3054 domain-containing protein [Ferrimicrobium sp.]